MPESVARRATAAKRCQWRPGTCTPTPHCSVLPSVQSVQSVVSSPYGKVDKQIRLLEQLAHGFAEDVFEEVFYWYVFSACHITKGKEAREGGKPRVDRSFGPLVFWSFGPLVLYPASQALLYAFAPLRIL